MQDEDRFSPIAVYKRKAPDRSSRRRRRIGQKSPLPYPPLVLEEKRGGRTFNLSPDPGNHKILHRVPHGALVVPREVWYDEGTEGIPRNRPLVGKLWGRALQYYETDSGELLIESHPNSAPHLYELFKLKHDRRGTHLKPVGKKLLLASPKINAWVKEKISERVVSPVEVLKSPHVAKIRRTPPPGGTRRAAAARSSRDKVGDLSGQLQDLKSAHDASTRMRERQRRQRELARPVAVYAARAGGVNPFSPIGRALARSQSHALQMKTNRYTAFVDRDQGSELVMRAMMFKDNVLIPLEQKIANAGTEQATDLARQKTGLLDAFQRTGDESYLDKLLPVASRLQAVQDDLIRLESEITSARREHEKMTLEAKDAIVSWNALNEPRADLGSQ